MIDVAHPSCALVCDDLLRQVEALDERARHQDADLASDGIRQHRPDNSGHLFARQPIEEEPSNAIF
ncbi:hypothetical protein D3C81_1370490 [compost metagenome]